MKHLTRVIFIAIAVMSVAPPPAHADGTAFWGFSSAPAAAEDASGRTRHAAKGFAVGIGLIIVGFEVEYASTSEVADELTPSLRTGMVNGMIQTPTRNQLYLTMGGGFYRERLGEATETNLGTNVGGGVKLGLMGPLRLRLDYRLFSLRGQPIHSNPQRFYAGLNFAF